MTATLQQDETILINAQLRNERKDFSFANADRALQSSPMIGETFLELLRTAADGTEEWVWRSAAWLVLAVAEQALETGQCDARRVALARAQLHKVKHVSLRHHLQRILDLATGTEYVRDHWRSTAAQRMLDYGVFLRSIAHFAASAEVYAMVAHTKDLPPGIRMTAYQGIASALRELGQPDNADVAYIELRAFAEGIGATHMELEAELGLAKVTIGRGDLPQAESMVLAVLARAQRIRRVEAKAYIDMACIAGIRERYDEAILYLDRALAGPLPPIDRDLSHINMAMAYRMLRRFPCAASVARPVARHAIGLDERVGALLILYHLAMDQGLDPTEYRDQLAACERMSPQKRAELYEASARDAWFLEDRVTCQAELARGLAFAEGQPNRLNAMIIRFDSAIRDMEAGKMPAIFVAPNNLAPDDTAPALRRIEDRARRTESLWIERERLWADSPAASHPPRLLVETFVNRVVAAGA